MTITTGILGLEVETDTKKISGNSVQSISITCGMALDKYGRFIRLYPGIQSKAGFDDNLGRRKERKAEIPCTEKGVNIAIISELLTIESGKSAPDITGIRTYHLTIHVSGSNDNPAPHFRLEKEILESDKDLHIILAEVELTNGNCTKISPKDRHNLEISAEKFTFIKSVAGDAVDKSVINTNSWEISSTEKGLKISSTKNAKGELGSLEIEAKNVLINDVCSFQKEIYSPKIRGNEIDSPKIRGNELTVDVNSGRIAKIEANENSKDAILHLGDPRMIGSLRVKRGQKDEIDQISNVSVSIDGYLRREEDNEAGSQGDDYKSGHIILRDADDKQTVHIYGQTGRVWLTGELQLNNPIRPKENSNLDYHKLNYLLNSPVGIISGQVKFDTSITPIGRDPNPIRFIDIDFNMSDPERAEKAIEKYNEAIKKYNMNNRRHQLPELPLDALKIGGYQGSFVTSMGKVLKPLHVILSPASLALSTDADTFFDLSYELYESVPDNTNPDLALCNGIKIKWKVDSVTNPAHGGIQNCIQFLIIGSIKIPLPN